MSRATSEFWQYLTKACALIGPGSMGKSLPTNSTSFRAAGSFVKPGEVEARYSRILGQSLDSGMNSVSVYVPGPYTPSIVLCIAIMDETSVYGADCMLLQGEISRGQLL